MANSDAYLEEISSQIPALQLLINMGWQYLTPGEALALRGGRESAVVLTEILGQWLVAHNEIVYKGRRYAFTEGEISDAVERLVNEPFQSLLVTNERVYELLTLGTSIPHTIAGDRRSYSLHYIDWQHPENNVYHVTDEFSVERRGSHKTRRPDIVLFVNGIPLAVIECKRADQDHHGEKAVVLGIEQLLTYQREDEIAHLFAYSQLLMTISPNDALYATTGTSKKFWAMWREDAAERDRTGRASATTQGNGPAASRQVEADVHALINDPLDAATQARLYEWREYSGRIRTHFAALGERLPNAQDRLLHALLRPERLLELSYQFIVYDGGIKKIARYQQYFAIKATIDRVAQRNAQGTRTGGVIWHTTGSGKSLTMVMLAKALALHAAIANPRVILVTDRVDLDAQLFGTFRACGKHVVQANSGKHLVRLVTGEVDKEERRADIITTVINKFDQAAANHIQDDGVNIFVLVDESHRSQYGSMHTKMQRVFPNACFIGFTGTPLTKREKSTAEKFGSFIHKYPMRQAVADQAVVPLLYEGRIVDQDVDKGQLERWFDRTTAHLTAEQKADLKRKMSRSEAVNATEQRIQEIAYNIALHYEQNWRGTGFKGQVATPSKEIGRKYLRYLREYGIDAALAISPPDTREGADEVDGALPAIQDFWKQMMDRYGSEEAYTREVLASFGRADGLEILVVVDKFLTGFDEPRNTVLYIDKPLKEHTLLQAIARVNRLADGKEFGYIIDYRGVLGELNEAMNLYDALADYELEDVEGTFADVSEEIAKLPQRHSDLWAIFAPVANQRDRESMERFLEPEDRRQRFYEVLTDYARALRVALASVQFYEETPEARVKLYKDDLKFFDQLRRSIKMRYAEAVDYRDYEDKVRKLMDQHVRATGTSIITRMVNVFDVEAFDAEVAQLDTSSAKADTILNRMKRTITEHMDEDPAFYRRFAEMVEETILAYRQGRIDQLEYLQQAEAHLQQMRQGHGAGLPTDLARYQHASAYYGVVHDTLSTYGLDDEAIAALAIRHEALIEARKVTDWDNNHDVQQAIKRELDDVFYEVERRTGIEFDMDDMDLMIERIIEVAKARGRAG